MPDLSFSIQAFSMCSPATGSVTCLDAAEHTQWQDHVDDQSWRPDDSFMPKRQLRRLSRLSKMALFCAHHANAACDGIDIGAPIFCSRYGELNNTANVLSSIQNKELVSPMDFSYAVHNTGQGLFSILHKDTRPATALSARESIVEEALVKAYAQLENGNDAVLVVYQEDDLPEAYKGFSGKSFMPLSFGLVLKQAGKNTKNRLTLSFQPEQSDRARKNYNQHEQNIAKLFLNGGGETTLQSKRMQWNWRYETH